MLGDVVTVETVLIGSFDELQALFVEFIDGQPIAVNPVEDAKFYRGMR